MTTIAPSATTTAARSTAASPPPPAVDNPMASAVFDCAWMAPGYKPTPGEALPRIQALCQLHEDLFNALFVVVATHPGMRREILAEVVRQGRPELKPFTRGDVVGMLVAVQNAGRQGFEAVLRTRKTAGAKPAMNAALPWAAAD